MPGRDHCYRQSDGVPMGAVRESEPQAAVRRIAEPILASLGLVLVEVEVRGRGHSFMRLVIERPATSGHTGEGVTVEDCERAHTLIGHALDVEDPIPHSYVLEVSSPGLDRPIRTVTDYERFQGRLARFKLTHPVEGQRVLIGRIQKVEGTEVWVEASSHGGGGRPRPRRRQETKPIALALANIQEARLEVEF